MQADIFSPALRAGSTVIRTIQPGAGVDNQSPLGVPWIMELATGTQVYGAYWHNRFGVAGEGQAIELPTFAARWLYEYLLGCRQQTAAVIIE
jgi:hypothetical protein